MFANRQISFIRSVGNVVDCLQSENIQVAGVKVKLNFQSYYDRDGEETPRLLDTAHSGSVMKAFFIILARVEALEQHQMFVVNGIYEYFDG